MNGLYDVKKKKTFLTGSFSVLFFPRKSFAIGFMVNIYMEINEGAHEFHFWVGVLLKKNGTVRLLRAVRPGNQPAILVGCQGEKDPVN